MFYLDTVTCRYNALVHSVAEKKIQVLFLIIHTHLKKKDYIDFKNYIAVGQDLSTPKQSTQASYKSIK